jgi:hypothetical protein
MPHSRQSRHASLGLGRSLDFGRSLGRWLVLGAALSLGACAQTTTTIPGTKIPDDRVNRSVLDTIEAYRLAVEKRDAQGLLLMASPNYWEDSGTPIGSDDYGFQGLQQVLTTRFQAASDVRYAMKYVSLRRACPHKKSGDELEAGCKAQVDVLIDASFTVLDARNQQRRLDKRDQNQIVLEWNGERWLFLSGM